MDSDPHPTSLGRHLGAELESLTLEIHTPEDIGAKCFVTRCFICDSPVIAPARPQGFGQRWNCFRRLPGPPQF